MSEPLELHLPLSGGEDPVALLAAASGLSKRRVKQAMQRGAVWLTRGASTKRIRRGRPGRAGEELHLYYDPRVLDAEPPAAELLADEGDYSVWFKPYGLRAQGSRWGDHCTVERWVAQQLQREAFTVHRLDRAASGVILIAHGKRAAAALGGLFRERRIEKRYRIVVHGRWPHPEPVLLDAALDAREARSWVEPLELGESRSLLEVRLESGRKHQIRRHLAGAGFPVVGDRFHGRSGDAEDLQLCARVLAFRCPLADVDRRYLTPDERLPVL